MRAALAAVYLLALTGCRIEADYDATGFACEATTACPPAFACVDGMCRRGGGGAVDAGADGGGPDGPTPDAPEALPPYAAAVLADGPLLYLRFDEADGAIAVDASGNGRHGTLAGGTGRTADGAMAGSAAVEFDGVDDRIVVGDDEDLRLNGDFTIEMWVRLDEPVNTYPGLVSKGDSGNGTGYIMYYRADSRRLNLKRAGVDLLGDDTLLLTVGAYRHFVVTYEAEAQAVRWYMDGALVRAITGVTFTTNDDDAALEIGRGDEHGRQAIDEVAFYPVALAADRVAAHFALGDD